MSIKPWTKDRIGKQLQALAEVDVISDSIHLTHDGPKVRVWKRVKLIRKEVTAVPRNLNSNSESAVQLPAHSVLSFRHLRPDELGFGADCEYCGKHNSTTYVDSDNRLVCKECAGQ